MGLLRLYLRRLRSERLSVLALVVLVFVTALLLVSGPRLLERLSASALVDELAAAPATERAVVVNESSRPSADVPATLDEVTARTASLAGQLPSDVSTLVADERFVVDSTSWQVFSGTRFESLFFLRVQQGIEQHVELVDGRLPTSHTAITLDPRPGALPNQRATIYEVMLSQATAQEVGVSVGQDLPVILSQVDRRNAGVDLAAILRVVGIYRISTADDPFWLNDTLVSGYRFHPVGSNTVYVEADALLATDAYGALANHARSARLPLSFQWRYQLDVTRIDANHEDELAAGLRRLAAHPPRSGVSDIPTDSTLSSGLLRLLLDHQARWQSATALLGVVGTGALFVAASCLTLVALLASVGRRRASALVLARGAGGRWLRLALVAEALLLSLPATLLAVTLAVLVMPDASLAVSLAAGGLVVVAACLLLTGAGLPAGGAAAARRGGETSLSGGHRPTPRQLVIEGALVVGAVASAFVLRERGLAGVGDASTLGADPLMVAVPALVGLAAGVAALRLYPLISGLLARLAGWPRGIVFALASRRAARGRSSAAVLLTIIATASVAGFAGAGWTTLDQAAQLVGWQTVGAPFQLSARDGGLPAGLDLAAVAGVRSTAPAWSLAAVVGGQPVTLVALDTVAYDGMTRATPADLRLPPDLLTPLAAEAQALPVIASGGLGLNVGDGAGLTIGAQAVSLRVAGLADSFALAPGNDRFVLLSHDQLSELVPALLGDRAPNAIFVDAPVAATAALTAVAAGDANLALLSQQQVAATLAASPVNQAVSFGLAASALAAAAYAALAVAAAFVLAAADQRTETAYLRVLGLTRAQRLRLIFSEHVPATLLATIAGGALGVLVFVFVRPGLGLASIAPAAANIELAVDAGQILLLIGAALLIVLPAWALAAFAQREANPAAAIREGSA
jgi:putative ABC transport system permease protein